MINKQEEGKIYFGLRAKNPLGNVILEGPFISVEEAKKVRQGAKEQGFIVSVWFVAHTKEEALIRAEESTGRI